jgi:hypothetical protein
MKKKKTVELEGDEENLGFVDFVCGWVDVYGCETVNGDGME